MIRSRQRSHEVGALLLRRTDFGEADLILLVLTDKLGKLSVMARAARKSHKRFVGCMEPFHGLTLNVVEPTQGELYRLQEAKLRKTRLGLVQNLAAMTVAGRALSWVRRSLPLHTSEPDVFASTEKLLDQLDEHPPETTSAGEALLGEFGLLLLYHLGWALELSRCVCCGRVCPEGIPSTLDPRRGGLVCRNCGGGRYRLSASLRTSMFAASRGRLAELAVSDASAVLDIVEQTLAHHPGVQET